MKIDYHTIYKDVLYLQYGCDDEYLRTVGHCIDMVLSTVDPNMHI